MKNRGLGIFVLACLLLFPSLVAAAINLPVPWQQGMHVRYKSTSVQEKVRAGKQQRVETRETSALDITRADHDGFVQVWHSENPSVQVSGDTPNIAADRVVAEQLVYRFRELPLQARLDHQGAYKGIVNWQDVATAIREVMLPMLVRQARARPDLARTDEAKLTAMLTPALQRMTGEQAINSTVGRQIALFNYFTAASLAPHTPASYQDSIASPWSADLIPTTGSFEMTKVDIRTGTVTIVWKQSIDPVKGVAAAWKMVEALAGKPLPKGKLLKGLPIGLVLVDQATVVLDRKSGLPLQLQHRREVAFGGNSSIDTWTLEKVAAR